MNEITDKTPNNRHDSIMILIISLFIVFGLLKIWRITADKFFLEHKNSAYFDLFVNNLTRTNCCNCKDIESGNLLVLEKRKEQEFYGITLAYNEDGTIYVKGKNSYNGDLFLRLSPFNRFILHDGEYIISDGLNEEQRNGVLFYYESRDIFSDHTDYTRLANLPEQTKVKVENSFHDDFGLVLGFKANFETTEPLIIYPMIRKADDMDGKFEPPAMLKANIDENQPAFQTFLLEKAELSQLTDSDWKLLCNSVNYQFKEKYNWTSIIFEDGTGIQFKESDANQAVYGPIDPWGRIEYIVCEIRSLDDVRAVCSPV